MKYPLKTTKFYLAAKFSRRAEMEKKAEELRALGYEPCCRWVFGGEDGLTDQQICDLDLDDVAESDLLILFTHPRGEPQPGGGRFVEYGYALALGVGTVVIGPRENIFINHRRTERFDTWVDFLDSLMR